MFFYWIESLDKLIFVIVYKIVTKVIYMYDYIESKLMTKASKPPYK